MRKRRRRRRTGLNFLRQASISAAVAKKVSSGSDKAGKVGPDKEWREDGDAASHHSGSNDGGMKKKKDRKHSRGGDER